HRKRTALAVLVTSPHVVDEEIEPPVIVVDPPEQRLDLRIDGVIAADSDAAAAAIGHFASRLLDRTGHVVRRRPAVHASAADVDRGTGGAELERNTASCTPARAGDEGHHFANSRIHQFANSPIHQFTYSPITAPDGTDAPCVRPPAGDRSTPRGDHRPRSERPDR